MPKRKRRAHSRIGVLEGLWVNNVDPLLLVERIRRGSYAVSIDSCSNFQLLFAFDGQARRLHALPVRGDRLLLFATGLRTPHIWLNYSKGEHDTEFLTPSVPVNPENVAGAQLVNPGTPYQKVPRTAWSVYSPAILASDLATNLWHPLFCAIDHLMDELSELERTQNADHPSWRMPERIMRVDHEFRWAICDFDSRSNPILPPAQTAICRAVVCLSLLKDFITSECQQIEPFRSDHMRLMFQRFVDASQCCLDELTILCLPTQLKSIENQVRLWMATGQHGGLRYSTT